MKKTMILSLFSFLFSFTVVAQQPKSKTIQNLQPKKEKTEINTQKQPKELPKQFNKIACDENQVNVVVILDNYPEETSWSIKNTSGVTIATGEYSTANPDGSIVTESLCLPDGCYEFVITDSYGDGICCTYGFGAYGIISNDDILVSGGSFGSVDVANFCIGEIVSSCSDGIQNGDETGVDCGGPFCQPCVVPCIDNEIEVSITFDDYPEETGWSINNTDGVSVASGTYSVANPDGSTVTETLCLPNGCYNFVITDSYGDGICCDFGNGSYSVTNGEEVLASGGSFNNTETTNFCVDNRGPQPTCSDGVQNGDETGVDCGGTDCEPCTEICTDISVVVAIVFDAYPEETSWVLNDANGTTVASANYTSDNDDYSTIEQTLCLPEGCYDFIISDASNDGMCCSYGNGSYTITDNDGVLGSGASFQSSETTNFCVGSESTRIAGVIRPVNINNNDFKMYPNPAKDVLNIKLKGDIAATYKIMDITGKTVIKGELMKSINLESLQAGVYFIQVNDGVATMNKKFIKQ
ncbi:T9SS type A sorting domain-containing protein [Pontimicrobium sp. MEBiC06410]